MADENAFQLDLSQQFPHLANAPVAEAVLELRTRINGKWEEAEIAARLKAALPDSPTIKTMRGYSFTARFPVTPLGAGRPWPRQLRWIKDGWG